jgi:hypothetical protein
MTLPGNDNGDSPRWCKSLAKGAANPQKSGIFSGVSRGTGASLVGTFKKRCADKNITLTRGDARQ